MQPWCKDAIVNVGHKPRGGNTLADLEGNIAMFKLKAQVTPTRWRTVAWSKRKARLVQLRKRVEAVHGHTYMVETVNGCEEIA